MIALNVSGPIDNHLLAIKKSSRRKQDAFATQGTNLAATGGLDTALQLDANARCSRVGP